MTVNRSTLIRTALTTTILAGAAVATPAAAQSCSQPVQSWSGANTSHAQNPGATHLGGDGEWNATSTNWEDADGTHRAWAGPYAAFRGPLRVQDNVVVRSQVTVQGDQQVGCMAIDRPYRFAGPGRLVAPESGLTIRVGNDEILGATATPTADFDIEITGPGHLFTEGNGTLVMRRANTFTDGISIGGGRLDVRATGALGAGSPNGLGDVSLSSGTLSFTGTDIDASAHRIWSTGGVLDISAHTAIAGLNLGSLHGFGTVRLGDQTLVLGDLDFDDEYGGTIMGSNLSQLVKTGSGVLELSGNNSYTGFTTVREGTLRITGSIRGDVGVYAGTLDGVGAIGGDVSVVDGATLAGTSNGTMRIGGDLLLGDTSNIDVRLGAPSQTPVFSVQGALTLDGRLNVSAAGGFGGGDYRLINYSGALTNNGLVVATAPLGFNPGDFAINTGVAGQVTLVVPGQGGGANTQYWDGTRTTPGNVANGRGGSGIWSNGPTNWTNQAGTINAPWAGGIAAFALPDSANFSYRAEGGIVDTDDVYVQIASDGVSAAGLRILELPVGQDRGYGNRLLLSGGTLNLLDGAKIDSGKPHGRLLSFAPLNAAGSLMIVGEGKVELRDLTVVGDLTITGGRISFPRYVPSPGPEGAPFVVPTTDPNTRIGGNLIVSGGVVSARYRSLDYLHILNLNGTIIFGDSIPYNADVPPSFGLDDASNDSRERIFAGGVILGARVGEGGAAAIGAGLLDLGNGDMVIGDAGTGSFMLGYPGEDYDPGGPGGTLRARDVILGRAATGRGVLAIIGGYVDGDVDGVAPPGATEAYQGNVVASRIVGGAGGGVLALDHFLISDPFATEVRRFPLAFTPTITGNVEVGVYSGETHLSGTHDYTGATIIGRGPSVTASSNSQFWGGVLILDNARLTNTSVDVRHGILGGAGLVGGSVTVHAGGGLEGRGGGTLEMASLSLDAASRVNVALGAPTASAIFAVDGNLVLDGTLNVTDAGGYGEGLYRLFSYGGALTDNGLALGTRPGEGTVAIQTSVAQQVNLIVGPDRSIQFWDGANTTANGVIDGGSGTWGGTTRNWANAQGGENGPWTGNMAVFQGMGGTVTIAPEGVSTTRIQFAGDGYTVTGGSLTLNTPAAIRVGDGTAAGAGVTATIASAIQGAGGLDKSDLGTLVLTGTNSYTGGTRVSAGVVQAGSDAALGAASGGVTLDGGGLRAGGALTSARSFTIGAGGGRLDTGANAVTLSGAIAGSGALTRTGSGTLTLSGNSAGYNGGFALDGGTLTLSGTLGGTLTVGNGASLGGTGNLNNLVVASGGRIAPGNSVGTLSATGNLTFRAGSIFDLELAATGGTDLLSTTGIATIEGGTVRVATLDPQTQYVDGRRHTFLTAAGGRVGTFTDLTENSAFLDFALGYDPTSAYVTVSVVRTFPDVAQTFNQRQSSGALATFGRTPGSDSLAVYNTLLFADADAARMAFDNASGEIYATALASGLRRAEGDVRRLLGQAQAGVGEGWSLWGALAGQDGSAKGDGNGARFTHDAIGGSFGLDYRGPDNGWAVGLGGGWWNGGTRLDDRASRADADGWHVGGHARLGTGAAGFTATLATNYGNGSAKVRRTVSVAGLTRGASAGVDLTNWALAAELRYGISVSGNGQGTGWAVGPAVRLVHVKGRLGQFAERGADSLDLSAAGQGEGRTRYGGGLFARWTGAAGAIDVSALYVGGGADPTEVSLTMAGAPANAYRVGATRGAGDGIELGLAGRYAVAENLNVGGGVTALAGSRERHVTGNATIQWRF